LQHLLASTAIPTLFPAVRINREYFGDGAIRQLAPLSPAIHPGADRIMAIGVSANTAIRPDKDAEPVHPSLAQILAHILNSAFGDTLASDMETLRRINTLLPLVRDAEALDTLQLRHSDLVDIAPSQKFHI